MFNEMFFEAQALEEEETNSPPGWQTFCVCGAAAIWDR